MPHEMQFRCYYCQEDIHAIESGGRSLPIVLYVVVGQVPGSGPALDLTGFPLPELVHELMAQPVARRECCARLACLSKLAASLGVP